MSAARTSDLRCASGTGKKVESESREGMGKIAQSAAEAQRRQPRRHAKLVGQTPLAAPPPARAAVGGPRRPPAHFRSLPPAQRPAAAAAPLRAI